MLSCGCTPAPVILSMTQRCVNVFRLRHLLLLLLLTTLTISHDSGDGIGFENRLRCSLSKPSLRRFVTWLCCNRMTCVRHDGIDPCSGTTRQILLCSCLNDCDVLRTAWAQISPVAQPLQPQLTHSTTWSSFNCVFGMRQIQVLLKFVSLVWIHLKQHNYQRLAFMSFEITIL